MRVYDKLGISNRVELVLYALAHRGAETPSPHAPKRPSLSLLAEDCLESMQIRVGGVRLPVHSDN
jgi:hypothetical protein